MPPEAIYIDGSTTQGYSIEDNSTIDMLSVSICRDIHLHVGWEIPINCLL